MLYTIRQDFYSSLYLVLARLNIGMFEYIPRNTSGVIKAFLYSLNAFEFFSSSDFIELCRDHQTRSIKTEIF